MITQNSGRIIETLDNTQMDYYKLEACHQELTDKRKQLQKEKLVYNQEIKKQTASMETLDKEFREETNLDKQFQIIAEKEIVHKTRLICQDLVSTITQRDSIYKFKLDETDKAISDKMESVEKLIVKEEKQKDKIDQYRFFSKCQKERIKEYEQFVLGKNVNKQRRSGKM